MVKHMAKKSKKEKKEKIKGRFSKFIVVFCVIEMMLMQAWAMWIADKDTYSTDGLVVANHAVFGGELLLLCLKRILVKDENTQETKIEKDKENIYGSTDII